MKTILHKNKDYLFHFTEGNIFLMKNHRYSLWCWINELDRKDYGKYCLVHVDTHHDCGEIYPEERFNFFLNNLEEYIDIGRYRDVKYKNKGKEIDLIGNGNFLGLALRDHIFSNNYLFTRADNVASSYEDTFNGMNNGYTNNVKYFETENFSALEQIIDENDNIFLDIDLDYFIDNGLGSNGAIFSDDKYNQYVNLFKNSLNKFKLITIAVTDDKYNHLKDIMLKEINCNI